RFLGRFATAIVANSSGGFSFWRGSKAAHFVVPNALALDEIAAAPRDETDFGASRVILFVGRLDVEKNLSNLVAALRDVIEQRDAVALLCGVGPKEDEVRADIEQAGYTDRIRLLGYTDRVWSLMKRADVLVAPSWFEGHPNVVMEAAAAGCPLVLSDIPAHRECLDDAALFAAPEDPKALARAILQALDDPADARARAERARTIAAGWSIERAAAAHLRIYEGMARGNGRVSPYRNPAC
ncbi:MAG TPA: glycosyltransferase, partial [Thermoanaerobaculia bacterium]